MKVTRIATSKNLNPGKYASLEEQARRLGTVRSEVWQRYGSVGGVNLLDRTIRDEWLAQDRTFPVSANLTTARGYRNTGSYDYYRIFHDDGVDARAQW